MRVIVFAMTAVDDHCLGSSMDVGSTLGGVCQEKRLHTFREMFEML